MGRLSHPMIALRRAKIMPAWVRRVDARASRTINGHRHLPKLDRALARLSHSADRSRLWLAIAAMLYLLGGARRRGAVRGVASLIVGSALANLVGKRVFGGDRPVLKDVPLPRRLKKFPTSASFPSGHSASAAAFATGVALESPRAGVLVAPLAATVAYSRLHVGAHWLSDVLGGAALGAGVAVVGRMLVPARARDDETPTAPVVPLPALEDGAGVFIVVNPVSGIDPLRPDPVQYLSETLPAATIHALEEGDDIAAIMQRAAEQPDPPRVLGVYGGDGSVATVAHAARRAGLPLLALPGGTFNHFVRTAGIPTVEAGIEALQSGAGRRVDVAELTLENDPPFTVLNVASVGVYPAFVSERETMQDRLGKPVAAIIAAVRVLARAETIDVSIDSRRARVWSVAIATGENPSASMIPLQRRSLDDAQLEVRVLHAYGRMPRLRGLVALALGQRASDLLDRLPLRARLKTIESLTARTVRLEVHPRAGQDAEIAHDGEVSVRPGYEEDRVASIRIMPGGLDVYSVGPGNANS